jgi:hypothetical protein
MKKPTQHLADLQQRYGSFFSKAELEIRGGSLDGIHPDLMSQLYGERAWHKLPTFLSSVHRPGDNKSHGRGEAADKIIFQNGRYMRDPVSPVAHWTIATTWPWMGVGLYLDWRFQSRDDGQTKRTSGIHTDISTHGTRPLRWVGQTFLGNGRVASIAQITDKNVQTRRHFFYQSEKDGKFYSAESPRVLSMQDVWELWVEGLRADEDQKNTRP